MSVTDLEVCDEEAATLSPVELKGLSTEELEVFALSVGLDRYRGRQLAQWIYGHGVTSFEVMTNLGRPIREMLSARASILSLDVVETAEDAGGRPPNSCSG